MTEESKTCPVCGAANRCAIACGQEPRGCWCMSVDVPTQLIEALPPSAAGQCVCRRCIDHFHATGRLRRYVADSPPA